MKVTNQNFLPLYALVTGVKIPQDSCQICGGIRLSSDYGHVFALPMLAFSEAPPNSHTPGPWVSVSGGSHSFHSHVQLEVSDLSNFPNMTSTQAAWLVAALLRLKATSPVRITAIADRPLSELKLQSGAPHSFESSSYQLGIFDCGLTVLSEADIGWLRRAILIAAQLYNEDRFTRALSVLDESAWSGRVDLAVVLIWTAMEILFQLGNEQHKTKAISSAVSNYVGANEADRAEARNVIRSLYTERGGFVHAGRAITEKDYAQSLKIARYAFVKVIDSGYLPPGHTHT